MPFTIGDITLDAQDLVQACTMRVRIVNARQWRVRLEIARWLIMLASRFACMDVWIEYPEADLNPGPGQTE